MKRSCLPLLAAAALALALPPLAAADPLPGTAPLDWLEEDLPDRLMDGAHAFVERKITEAAATRARFWSFDFSSPEAYAASVAPNRERFRRMIGAVDDRVPTVEMEKFGQEERPGLVAETEWFRVWQVRWPVLEGLWGEGLLVEPTGGVPDHAEHERLATESPGLHVHPAQVRNAPAQRFLVALPDADETPEQVLGIGIEPPLHHRHVAALARAGITVLVPALINREIYLGDEREPAEDARLKTADISHREWIYRQAFHLGRHVLGYEVQQVLAAIDWFAARAADPVIAVGGYGEGALVALAAAAVDTRIETALAGGYLGGVTPSWEQPIFRNLFGFEKEFGVSGLIALLGHRQLAVHLVSGPVFASAKGELDGNWDWEPETFLPAPDLADDHPARWMVNFNPSIQAGGLFNFLTGTETFPEDGRFNAWLQEADPAGVSDLRETFSPAARHERLFRQMEAHVQRLIREADAAREEWFLYQAEPALRPGRWSTEKEHPTLDPSRFIEQASAYREIFAREAMGEFDEPMLPPAPRSRRVAETDAWTAWDVVLDVYPELFAWGTLVLPKGIAPGERRPVVVCQHGRNGLPRDCIDGDKSAYNNFAARLAERGFITFSPHNLYRGEDRYRWLDRKANAVGCTLFSFIIPSHRQILGWLATLPQADGERIAFYGLSYGGESAMRVPALLEDYAAVICSGDFNQWTRKVAATDYPRGFLRSIEWEMPFWNLGHTFDYAEMAYLIFPRPFLVERGHHDLVASDPWVAHEYAKVRRLYAQFGMAGRAGIEWFQGGHSIRGEGSFDFLHRHLGWPRKEADLGAETGGRKPAPR